MKKLIVFIFSFWAIYLCANDFKQLSINEGLFHSDANCVTQDSTGLIWIGTYAGLHCYDGFSLKRYDYYPDNQRIYLSHNRILSIACADNFMWVGTESGLACFDLKTSRYVSYKILGDSLYMNGSINGLYFNPNDKNLVIRTYNDVVLGKVYGDTVKVLPWNSDEERILSKKFTTYHLHNNDVYGVEKDGKSIIVLDEKDGKAIVKTQIFFDDILNESIIRRIRFQGEYLYIRTEKEILRLKMDNGIPDRNTLLYLDLSGTDLVYPVDYNFVVTSLGDILCNSSNGITEIKRPYSEMPTYHKHIEGNYPYDVSVLRITDMLIDKYNSLWITCTSRGVFYKNLSESFFKTLSFNDFRKSGLAQNEIVSVCEDENGFLWMIVDYRSLFRYDPINDSVTKITVDKNENLFLQCMYMSDDNTHIYIGTNMGLYLYSRKSGALKRMRFNADVDRSSISYIVKDCFDRLWVSTWGNGLFCINNGSIESSLSTKTDPKLVSDWISYIKIRNNNIYLCTQNGLNRIIIGDKGQVKNISSYQIDEDNKRSLTANYIVAIDCENDSTCWVGTIGGGLNKLILHSGNNNDYSAFPYTTRNGLSSNDCEIVMLDNDNNVWIGGNEISFLNQKNGHIELFNDASCNKAFKVCVSCKASNGFYYMGGLYGLTGFNPDAPNLRNNLSDLYFMDLTINNIKIQPQQTYDGNRILEYSLQYTDKIELNHQQNNFSISLSTLNSSIPQSIFRYRIKNLDDNWILLSRGENKVYFSGLPYGRYVLDVQNSSDNGLTWVMPGKQLEILVLPPWWLSIWMKLLYLVVLVATVAFILRHYIKELNLKKENELQKILLQNDEERYQSKIRFFMNVSHELKTPLTLILFSIEKILSREKLCHEYQVILSQSRRMLSLISELVDFRKVELGISDINFTCVNISDTICRIIDEMTPWIENKRLALNYEHDKEDIQMDADSEKINKLIINILSNAIKYTDEGGSIMVSAHRGKPDNIIPYYKSSYTEGMVENGIDSCIIIIRDTGIGISSDSIHLVYERFFQVKESNSENHLGSGIGLAIVKNIVLQHSGMITISSERSRGTEFIVVIPIRNECSNELAQTVEFDISTYLKENYNELPDIKEKIENEKNGDEQPDIPCLLIVEDNKDLREMLKEHFSAEYLVRTAVNGREGLELCLSVFPDIIVSDVMMPEMDGIEMCRIIKNNLSVAYTPIILLTAKDNIESEIEGYDSGADLYIPKPFSIRLLEINLRRLLKLHEQNIKAVNCSASEVIEHKDNCFNTNDDSKNVELSSMDEFERKELELLVEKIKKIIDVNIMETDLSPDFLANALCISRSNLYRKVKRIDGMSLADYVRNYRLEKAANLLVNSNCNIQEIVYEVGFINTSHFSKIFKLKYGLSPLEYKKKYN